MPTPARPVIIQLPVGVALLLVELVEEMGDLTVPEQEAVLEARMRIERTSARARKRAGAT